MLPFGTGRLRRGLGVRVQASAAPAGHTYGPELWPQPALTGSTGLTLVNIQGVAAGTAQFDGSGSPAEVRMTAPPTLVAGETYAYSIANYGQDAPAIDAFYLQIGDKTVSLVPSSGSGKSGTVTLGASPAQYIGFKDDDNNQSAQFRAPVSIKKQLS